MKKNQDFIKRENQNLILDLIQEHELIARAKLAKLANMSPTTVSRITTSLIDIGLVKETNQYTTGVGRKATLLSLNPDSLISIGVELDEKKIRLGFFDFLGKAIITEEIEKEVKDSPETVITYLKQTIFQVIETHHLSRNKIIGVCVGIPGWVDNKNGVVVKSAQLGWENAAFGQKLQEVLPFQVLVDNELKLKAYAEKMFRKDKIEHTIVVIDFGSGVGSALIVGGDVYRGFLNAAGEIGHTIVNPNGMLCTCGNIGCLQTYVAEGFLIQEASKQSDASSLEDIVEAAQYGHKWAVNILERAITYAAITVNNSVCMNNPDKVILTGKLIEQTDYLKDRILKESRNRIWLPLSDSTTIEISRLGKNGVILGAGMQSQREYINQLNYEKELV
ncbi:ROK family transcriptional regulator [Oceanobacillus timonensis]|uniref:ROK family transcriptional regulator n=1 Tax=Oceanobacillus timonensis TaxID=1926285 RepID=UPI0015C4C83E|nr:ROK family protein [Oceanobacillus timonensis]